MDRLMAEISHAIPQVFLQSEISAVKQELSFLCELSSRFRAASRVGARSRQLDDLLKGSGRT